MIDLHMHSYYSNDGEFSPSELVKKCADQDITIMSITDHNTVRATDEALKAARTAGIAYLPGIEIDCTYKNTNFHMLGYGIRWQARIFDEIEKNVRRQGQTTSFYMLKKTRELGFDVTENDMEKIAADSYWPETWTGEMFAEFLLSQPQYKNHPLLLPYREGGALSDNPYVNFYWDYYSQGKPCYAEMYYPDMEQIIEIIHENDGLAVLAHPHINLKGKNSSSKESLDLALMASKHTAATIPRHRSTRHCLPPGSTDYSLPAAAIFTEKQSLPSNFGSTAALYRENRWRNKWLDCWKRHCKKTVARLKNF